MDARDATNGNGSGHAGNGESHPHEQSLPSDVVPSKEGAPVESSSVDASAGAPSVEPLVVVDNDPPSPPAAPLQEKRVKLTPNQFAFLQALAAEAGNVSAAARRCQQARSNHDRWLKETDEQGNPTPTALAYHKLVQAIDNEACDEVEAEIRRRGVRGVEEPVFYQGEVCGYVQKFSDLLLIFRAKALMPEKYRERHEVTGAGGLPLHPSKVVVDVNVSYLQALQSLTEDELESHNAIAAKLMARAGGPPPSGAN